MTDTEFRQFRDLIYARTHIYCDESHRFLFEQKIRSLLKKISLPSFHRYYQLLTDPQQGEQKLSQLIEIIAVHETSFFRIDDHFTALKEQLFPSFCQQPDALPVKILSAGCSTGEEPYSIVMSFLDFLNRQEKKLSSPRKIDVLATDLSPLVIQKAREGCYSSKQVQKIAQPLLDKYFIPRNHQFYIKKMVKQFVTFELSNLVRLHASSEQRFNIIFCRNVLIYFDRRAQLTLLQALLNMLSQGGYLFLGDAESIHAYPEITRQLTLVQAGSAIMYQKHGATP